MKRSVEIGNWFVFIYLTTCAILMTNGDLSAGYGSGDIAFLLILVGCIVLHLIVLIGIYSKGIKRRNKLHKLSGLVFFVVALLFSYKLTIGRGPENIWEGICL